jgi:thioredoxin 1
MAFIILLSLPVAVFSTLTIAAYAEVGKLENRYMVVWYSKSCPPCKRMEPHIKKLMGEYPENIFHWDVEEMPKTAKQWKIDTVPTTILRLENKEADRQVGFRNYKQLKGILLQ